MRQKSEFFPDALHELTLENLAAEYRETLFLYTTSLQLFQAFETEIQTRNFIATGQHTSRILLHLRELFPLLRDRLVRIRETLMDRTDESLGRADALLAAPLVSGKTKSFMNSLIFDNEEWELDENPSPRLFARHIDNLFQQLKSELADRLRREIKKRSYETN